MGAGNILTVLDLADPDPGNDTLARLQLLRLANKHGCRGKGCRRRHKAQRDAHNADVRYLHQWLQMLGLENYEAKPRTDAVPQVMASAYERPLGRNE